MGRRIRPPKPATANGGSSLVIQSTRRRQWQVVLAIVTLAVVLVFLAAAKAWAPPPQTVPIPTTRQLQNGINIGLGLWAEPDPTLMGQAAVVCAGTSAMACVSAQMAVTTNAQSRGTAFLNDVIHNYPGAQTGLTTQGLWYKP